MERNMDTGAVVVGGPTSTGVLTRGQMARALREGSLGEARSGGTGGGVIAGAISRVDVRKYLNNRDLRSSCGCVTLAMLMAATITVAPTAGIPRNSANVPSSGPQPAGSIPRTPSPSVGDGNSVHPYVSDVNQGHQKKMLNKITGVTAAAVVGIAATVAGAQSGAVQWKVADGGNGHWYDAIHLEGDVTWYSFKVEAEDRGAHLATVTTSDENQFVFTLSVAKAAWYDGVSGPYLGARKLPNNSFAWVTGEEFNFTNWLPGEPNSGLWEPNLAYLGGSPGSHTPNPYWNDTNETTRWAMIEWEADCNNDSIVDYGQCLNGTLPDYNSNNTPDCCDRGEACVVGNYPVQWKVSDGGNGHWYGTLPGTGGNWYARAIEAEQKGGYLATVSDAAEFAFVQRVSPWIYYLGGYRIDPVPPNDPTDGWRWVTGEPFPYSLRCTGWYPDSERWITAAAWQDCLGESDNSGPPYYYMVEWSADCNNDGIVDYGQILTGQLSDANSNGVPDTCEFVDCNHDGIADSEQVARGQLPDYDGNNIPDCCERGEACVVGNYPVQWRTSEGGNGHWYLGISFDPAGASWAQAREDAIARGGDLVSLNTLIEREWVFNRVSRNPALWTTTLGPWVGGLQPAGSPEPAGGWMWVDGTPVYEGFYWNDYHPDGNNNCGGAANRMTYWGNYTQGIGDLFADCADRTRFQCWNIDFGNHPSSVIEWSADCNNDGTVDYGQMLRGELPDINHNRTPDTCECIGDIYVDGVINGADLGALLAYWGPTTNAAASIACDLNVDGVVNGSDLGILLAYWGLCSN